MAVMATELPQTIPVDQKIVHIAPEEKKVAVDEPVAPTING